MRYCAAPSCDELTSSINIISFAYNIEYRLDATDVTYTL